MKKNTAKKLAITAAIFTAAFNMNACAYGPPEEDISDSFEPDSNYNADVYGPPVEEFDTEISAVSEQSEQDIEAENGETEVEEAALTDLELDEMTAVNEAIKGLMNSEEYKALSTKEERTEAAQALVNTLTESGTEEYPYSLIEKASVSVNGDMISFSYKCGALGGIKTEPFDPMMN